MPNRTKFLYKSVPWHRNSMMQVSMGWYVRPPHIHQCIIFCIKPIIIIVWISKNIEFFNIYYNIMANYSFDKVSVHFITFKWYKFTFQYTKVCGKLNPFVDLQVFGLNNWTCGLLAPQYDLWARARYCFPASRFHTNLVTDSTPDIRRDWVKSLYGSQL